MEGIKRLQMLCGSINKPRDSMRKMETVLAVLKYNKPAKLDLNLLAKLILYFMGVRVYFCALMRQLKYY